MRTTHSDMAIIFYKHARAGEATGRHHHYYYDSKQLLEMWAHVGGGVVNVYIC